MQVEGEGGEAPSLEKYLESLNTDNLEKFRVDRRFFRKVS